MATHWEMHKETLRRHWIVEDRQLAEVARIMKESHGFDKSLKTYEARFRKWGVEFRKKKNPAHWNALGRKIQKRKLDGKNTTLYLNGKAMPGEILRRQTSRNCSLMDLQRCAREPSPQTPEGMLICTPPATFDLSHILFNLPFVRFQADLAQLITNKPSFGVTISGTDLRTFHEAKQLEDLRAILPASTLQDMTGPNGKSPVELLARLIYRISNNLDLEDFYQREYDEFFGGILNVLEEKTNRNLLMTLVRTKSPTTRAFVQKMLEFAIAEERPLLFRTIDDDGLTLNVWGHESGRAVLHAVRHQAYDVAKRLLNTTSNLQGPALSAALQRASSGSDIELVQLLIQAGADIDARGPRYHHTLLERTPLEEAARSGRLNVAELLVQCGAEVNRACGGSTSVMAPLRTAARTGNLYLAQLFIDKGAFLEDEGNGCEEREDSVIGLSAEAGALALATRGGHTEIVQVLLSAGAAVNPLDYSRDPDGYTALDMAISKINVEMVKLLLDCGANPGAHPRLDARKFIRGDCNPRNALYAAVTNGSTHIVQLLIAARADINEKSRLGRHFKTQHGIVDGYVEETALHCAILHSNHTMVRILLDAGALTNIPWIYELAHGQRWAESTMDLVGKNAKGKAEGKIARQILDADSSIAIHSGLSLLYIATDLDDLGLALRCVQAGADVHAHADPLKGTTLQYSVRRKQYNMAAYFMGAGVCVNAPASGYMGRTALQSAVFDRSTEWAQLLLEAGADVNAPACFGDRNHAPARDCGTALRLAAINGDIEMIDLLLGATPPATDNPWWNVHLSQTALQAAAQLGDLEVVARLLGASADIEAGSNDWRGTALQAAARGGHIEVVKYLLHQEGNINAVCEDALYGTALQEAATTGSVDLVRLLLDHGADPNIPGPSWHADDKCWYLCTPLLSAILKNCTHIARFLLDQGAQATISCVYPGLKEKSILEAAMKTNDIRLVEYVLKAGADPNMFGRFLTSGEGNVSGRPFKIEYWHTCSVLLSAVLRENIHMVQLLLENGATTDLPTYLPRDDQNDWEDSDNSDARDDYRLELFPLQMAVATSNLQIVSLLLPAGEDASMAECIDFDNFATDEDEGEHNLSLVSLAVLASSPETCPELVQLLISAGACIHVRPQGHRGRTALQAAAQKGNIKVVDLLLHHKADVNEPPSPKYGATALQLAAINGFARIAYTLLEAGANPDADGAEYEGRTALEGAAEHGRIDIVQMLLNACNEREVPKHRYARALEFAIEEGYDVIADMIKTEMVTLK